MDKQGETATDKVNIINMIKELIYLGIPSNMACFCKPMAQNWHKFFPSLNQPNNINNTPPTLNQTLLTTDQV